MRDTARWFDACNGYDEYDPFSLPRVEGWEAGLGQQDVRGQRVAVSVDLGAAVVASAVREKVEEAADLLIKDAGLERVEVPIALPRGGLEWALAGTASLLVGLGDLYPACESELTPEIMLAANIATNHYDVETAKNIEAFRREVIVQMAQIFEQVDFIICATNPDVAFGARGPMPTTVDGVDLVAELGFEAALGNNGALTIPANTTGHPAVAIPVGLVDGLPVSMQIIGRRHAEQLLLDLARDRRAGTTVALGGAGRTNLSRISVGFGARGRADLRHPPSPPSPATSRNSAATFGRNEKRVRMATQSAMNVRLATSFGDLLRRFCDFWFRRINEGLSYLLSKADGGRDALHRCRIRRDAGANDLARRGGSRGARGFPGVGAREPRRSWVRPSR